MMSGSRPHTHRSEGTSTHSSQHIQPAHSSGRNPQRSFPECAPREEARSSNGANSALAGAVPNIADRVRQRIFGPDTISVAERVQRWPLNPHAKSFPDPLQQQRLSHYARSLPDRNPQRSLDPYPRPCRPAPDTLPGSARDNQKIIATLGFGSPIELPSSPKRELQRFSSGIIPSSGHRGLPRPSPGPITRTLPELSDTVQVRSLAPSPIRQRDQPRLASSDMHSDPENEARTGPGSARPPPGFSERVSSKSFSSTTVSASVPGPGVSKGVSQQAMDHLQSAKADSGVAGAAADSSEKILQQSPRPQPPARTSSRPRGAPPGFPEKDPRSIFPPYMSTTEGWATARSRPPVLDLTQQSSPGSLPKGTGVQPCLATITIYPDPSNIAAIRRLINQYTYRIKAAKESQLRNRMEIQKFTAALDNTEILCHIRLRATEELPVLLEKPGQIEERKLLARQALLQRQGEDRSFEQRISSLRGRRGCLQDALSLQACPSEFRSRMKLALEYLSSIPDTFDPNVPGVNWDTCDQFEERPLD